MAVGCLGIAGGFIGPVLRWGLLHLAWEDVQWRDLPRQPCSVLMLCLGFAQNLRSFGEYSWPCCYQEVWFKCWISKLPSTNQDISRSILSIVKFCQKSKVVHCCGALLWCCEWTADSTSATTCSQRWHSLDLVPCSAGCSWGCCVQRRRSAMRWRSNSPR